MLNIETKSALRCQSCQEIIMRGKLVMEDGKMYYEEVEFTPEGQRACLPNRVKHHSYIDKDSLKPKTGIEAALIEARLK